MYTKDELRELKIAFWESFAAYCEVQPYLQGRKKIWILYDTKIKGVELKFDATRNGAYVILEINHRQEDLRDICFVRETGKEVARIYTEKTGIDIHRREHWGEFFHFMAQKMYLLERNFLEIADYLRE